MKGRRGKKVRQRRGIPALIPVSGICRASTAAAASNTKQEQEERDEDGSSQSCVVCQTCVGKMGCVSTDGSTAASLSQVRMSRTLTQHQGVTLGLLLLNMQLPCAGWQVPREHWQGEEQFTPKKPSGQVSLQLKERGKEEKCPQDQQLPALLPILPGSPVASLAEAVTRHRVTAPPDTLGAQQLASITKHPCRAGAVTADGREREMSPGPPSPAPMPTFCPYLLGYLGPVQPGSQRGQEPVSASQMSPCRQCGQGWRQPWP